MTAILAIPLLGEVPTIWQALGGTVALVGIYMVNRPHQQGRGRRLTLNASPQADY
ncbi:MAG: DMT family transporter [Candidatus Moduliflexus flocculans]|nr:DMT family transporter [Candidatus Moduliflexus flocculans]